MCGILAYWAKESVPPIQVFDILFSEAEKRGSDGVGITIYHFNHGIPKTAFFKRVGSYSSNNKQVLNFIKCYLKKGDLLLASCRATPETERATIDSSTLQPINITKVNELQVFTGSLIHNGGVTESIRNEFPNYKYTTNIDSEIILAAYTQKDFDMRKALEALSGSFAFVLYDSVKQKLYAATSFNPLAHMYIKGYGYFLHSSLEGLTNALHFITGNTNDGINVWESWYHHYIEGYTIIETDLDSGMQFKQTYEPRFLHPNYDNTTRAKEKIKVLVVASGGIDSGVTTHILNQAGLDVEVVHFTYGQKSQIHELYAIENIVATLGVNYRVVNLNELFHDLKYGNMLTDKNVKIDSGGDKIKSTIAWVPGRNSIFATYTMALAEQYILSGVCDFVYIAAGWSQLSEETGGYPDNSFQFARCLNELKDYGYITGKRIEFLPVLQRLTKTETWKLGYYLGFPFHLTCSCDNPRFKDNEKIELCMECGSTKLSMIAADRAGVKDTRCFNGERKSLSFPIILPNYHTLIQKLILPEQYKRVLQNARLEQN